MEFVYSFLNQCRLVLFPSLTKLKNLVSYLVSFLAVDAQLYKRRCPSVDPLVRLSVMIVLKGMTMRICDAAVISSLFT